MERPPMSRERALLRRSAYVAYQSHIRAQSLGNAPETGLMVGIITEATIYEADGD